MKDASDRWQRLKDVFSEIHELAPEARSAYLSKLRLNEKTIFEELSELLKAGNEAEEFLQKPLAFNSENSVIGETIGHYQIIREIGRGGMGAVFEAVRNDGEFEQKAAVKLTNRNLFSDELIRRFRAERQILARLEHENIVRLLDGGITAHHVPYFVMEFVEGILITEYCAENNLDIKERLRLFIQVCEAVAYAHRQLIVHRDLKPSNILVTVKGQAKLLDFGIAKILDSNAQTLTANAPLTPEYASPEQIKGEIVTTAADIYSLGIILFEILTNRPPSEIYGVERADIYHAVCESEPLRPSSVILHSLPNRNENLTNENKEQRTKDQERKTNPKSEIRNPQSLKGDLDNIILKALQKEKEERYASVEHFADDIRAYLSGLPVKAHPPHFWYRARKFVNRNRLPVSIAAASILLVMMIAAIAVWQAFAARQQRQIAEQNFNQVRKIANSLILDYHDEIAKLDGSTKLREKLVADALAYLDAISSEETESAELLKEMAIAYRKIGAVQGMPYAANLGKTDEAVKNLEKSVSLLEKALLIEPADLSLRDEIVKSYNELAQVLERTGKNGYETYRKAVEINDETVKLDQENIERKIYGLRLKMFANGASGSSDFEIIEGYKKILADAESLYARQSNSVNLIAVLAITSERIGNIYRWQGLHSRAAGDSATARDNFRNSESFARKSLTYMTRRQELDPNDANNRRRLFVANQNLASVLTYLDRLDEAEKHLEVAEQIVEQLKNNDPNNKQTVLDELAVLRNRLEILLVKRQPEQAFQFAERAIGIAENYERADPNNSEGLTWVGYFYNQQLQILKSRRKNTRNYEQILEGIKRKYVERFKSEPSFSGVALG